MADGFFSHLAILSHFLVQLGYGCAEQDLLELSIHVYIVNPKQSELFRLQAGIWSSVLPTIVAMICSAQFNFSKKSTRYECTHDHK